MARYVDTTLDKPHEYLEYGSRGMSSGDLMDGLGFVLFFGAPVLGAWLLTTAITQNRNEFEKYPGYQSGPHNPDSHCR